MYLKIYKNIYKHFDNISSLTFSIVISVLSYSRMLQRNLYVRCWPLADPLTTGARSGAEKKLQPRADRHMVRMFLELDIVGILPDLYLQIKILAKPLFSTIWELAYSSRPDTVGLPSLIV